jgi:serine/threonine-protein kinase
MTLSAGTRLGPYEVVASIGAGGMGEVYRARDAKLNRDVALKVLPFSVAQDPDRIARFRREAQVLAALNHPNIAHIHGFEEGPLTGPAQAGAHALVMELVEGPTLAERIEQGPMPLVEALPIAKQIAEALEAAHDQGIIHRDLKPSNVKIKDDGTVKVLDFGLAKAMGTDSGISAGDSMHSPTLTARATQLGVILGTAAYMSPEQAKGRQVDRRTDIWAFGVVLFEMLTGRRGYDAEDISETLAAVLTREVDWTALPVETPDRLKALVRECLVRDPRQRLRDIGEARRELQKIIEGAPEPSRPSTRAAAPGWTRHLPWAVAAAALLVAAVSTSVALRPASAPPLNVTRVQTVLKEFSALITVSSDGTKVAYTVAGGPNTTYLVLRLMDQFEGKAIAGTEGGAFPVFSPDGQWIAYSEIGGPKVRKIPLTGGTSIALCDGSFGFGAAWGADNTIVFAGNKGLMKVAAGGGTPVSLTTVDQSKGETAHRRPQFLPGGTHLLFTVQMKDADAGPQFAVLDLATGAYRTVARGGVNGRYVTSGHLTFMRGGTLFAAPFDLKKMAVSGEEVPVVEHVSSVGPAETGDYAVSDEGLLVYFSAGESQGTTLAWTDRAGVTRVLPGQSTRMWGTGRLSPDGRLIANGIDTVNGGRDIWIFDVERGTLTRVTFGGNNDLPVWTRDSRRIFFAGTVDGKHGIYRAPVDGSAKPEVVLATPSRAIPTSMSPDGRSVVYTIAGQDGPTRLMVVDLDAKGAPGTPRPLHESSSRETQGEISPNGRWVAYVSMESGAPELYVHAFPAAGARTRVSTEGGQSPRWSHDGRELFYWTGAPSTRLMSVDIPADDALRPGPPKLVFQSLSGTTWDVTPDRERFLIELTSTRDGVRLATVTNWFEELRRRAPARP